MKPQRIAIIGSGYVGTVAAACFAHVGHQVVALEVNQDKLNSLARAKAPFFEPGLDDLLQETLEAGTLALTSDYAFAMANSDTVFICVGTPAGPDGQPDMSAVRSAARSIAQNLQHHHVIVNKSTVPLGSGKWLMSLLEDEIGPRAFALASVVSNPEFLREGSSVRDFLYPDRVVIGGDDGGAVDKIAAIYEPILERAAADGASRAPVLKASLVTAELVKYASNTFLATKISFANEMARIAELVGADVTTVTTGMGMDPRIGSSFLNAGLGWGGSCLPKDVKALISLGAEYNYTPHLLKAAQQVNEEQRKHVVELLLHRLKTIRGAKIGVLGIAFKAGTDDTRDSAAVDIIRHLLARDARVVAHDPLVHSLAGIDIATDPYDAMDGAEALVIATEWPQYAALDFSRARSAMRGKLVVDGRNVLDPQSVASAGLEYVGIGRSLTSASSGSSATV